MASKQAHKRLMKEFAALEKEPPPFIVARPSDKNILEWHYVITGPPDSPYAHGEYHGKMMFPAEYPFKPPSIQIMTPNGRFKTHTRLCLSMSDYHPELWNPSWSVASILTGLLSFMLENTATTGSFESSDSDKRLYARQSRRFNRLQNDTFREVFPDLCKLPMDIPELDTAQQKQTAERTSTMSLNRPRDILDQDVILNELKVFRQWSVWRWLMVAVVGSVLAILLQAWMNPDSSRH